MARRNQRTEYPLKPRSFDDLKPAEYNPRNITAEAAEGLALRLRHTAATRIYEASGGDLILTCEFLGHASVQTTQVYAHADREKMRGAVERM